MGLTVDGYATASLYGDSSTKTATWGEDLSLGGVRWAALSYDAGGNTLKVMSAGGEDSVSTAGMGEISCDEFVRLRVGMVGDSGTPGTMLISTVAIWRT